MSNIFYNCPDDPNYRMQVAPDTRTITLWDDLLPIVKSQLRVGFDYDDVAIERYTKAAVLSIEQYLYLSIAPRAFNLDYVGQNVYPTYVMPLRNTVLETGTTTFYVGFEPLLSYGIFDAPAAWPVTIWAGVEAVADLPDDVVQAIAMLAASFYELRLTTELIGTYPPEFIYNLLPRYKQMAC